MLPISLLCVSKKKYVISFTIFSQNCGAIITLNGVRLPNSYTEQCTHIFNLDSFSNKAKDRWEAQTRKKILRVIQLHGTISASVNAGS